jgi:hypothetical protein
MAEAFLGIKKSNTPPVTNTDQLPIEEEADKLLVDAWNAEMKKDPDVPTMLEKAINILQLLYASVAVQPGLAKRSDEIRKKLEAADNWLEQYKGMD